MHSSNRPFRARGSRIRAAVVIVTLGCAAALAALASAPARAADPVPVGGRFCVRLAAGVSDMRLSGFNDAYTTVVDEYRQAGLQLETQREFPTNLIFGGDLLVDVGLGVNVGAGARYSWTRAYTLYGDYSGTLDIVGKVRMLAVQAVGQKAWPAGRISPFVEIRGGWAFVATELTERVSETVAGAGTINSELKSDEGAPLGEVHVGVRLGAGAYIFSATGGYRYCKVTSPEGELRTDGAVVGSGELAYDVDVSGFVLAVGVGRTFP